MHLFASSTFVALALTSLVSGAPASTCTNPVVRKEWRELTSAQKQDYLRAAVCLRNKPAQDYPQWATRHDDFVWTHKSLNTDIHFVAMFLPWHRWFVQHHENALRTECGYTGVQPYWDWSIDADAHNTANSPLFDAVDGFGGNGRLTGNPQFGFTHCVTDGPFANSTLVIGPTYPDFNAPINVEHCLTREFNSADGQKNPDGTSVPGDMQSGAYNSATLQTVMGMTNFEDFASILEGLPHAQVHSILFGDMGPASSPNEPLFFLHHAQVDRIWTKWQEASAARLTDYSGWFDQDKTTPATIDDIMPRMSLTDEELTVRNYMNTQSGPLCYTYS